MCSNKDQQIKNLKYLGHVLRNGTANIEGCMREIEKELKHMVEAVKAYKEDLDDENKLSDGKNFKDE